MELNIWHKPIIFLGKSTRTHVITYPIKLKNEEIKILEDQVIILSSVKDVKEIQISQNSKVFETF